MVEGRPDAQCAKRQGLRKVAVESFVCFFAYFLAIGPYVAISGLQSSINIEKSVGTISLGVTYVAALFTCVFVTPTFIRRFGCKYALLVGEFAHLLYIAGNFYPVSYVLTIAGLISGVGEGMIWSGLSLYCQYYGMKQSEYGTRSQISYIEKYNGVFVGCYFSGERSTCNFRENLMKVAGFIATYAFLYGGKTGYTVQKEESVVFYNSTTTPFANNSNIKPVNATFDLYSDDIQDDFKYCGANDCQDPDITRAHIDRYVPLDKTFFYILLVVFFIFSLLGIVLHIRYLPVANMEEIRRPRKEENVTLSQSEKENHREKKRPETISSMLVATYRHATTMKEILFVPLLLHNGLLYGFYMSELNRAYVSCVLGVEKVGLVLVVFASFAMVSSFSNIKIIALVGRNTVMVVLLLINLSVYIFCLLWRPQQSTSSLIFVLFCIVGIMQPAWTNCILSAYADYFPKKQEIALSLWNLWTSVGTAISFCWSPYLCVGTKICIQTALVTLAVIAYGVAEVHFRRGKGKNVRQETKKFIQEEESESLTIS